MPYSVQGHRDGASVEKTTATASGALREAQAMIGNGKVTVLRDGTEVQILDLRGLADEELAAQRMKFAASEPPGSKSVEEIMDGLFGTDR